MKSEQKFSTKEIIFLQSCKLIFEEFTKELFTIILLTVYCNATNILAFINAVIKAVINVINVMRFITFYIIFIICFSVT